MTETNETEIHELMQRYFDGLYQADSTVLRTVFHPELSYVNANAGNHEFMGLDAYMARVDDRTPPASRADPRDEAVERIELRGEQMGLVEARTMMFGREYHDFLTLIRTDEGWKILTKVFTYREPEA